MNEDLESFIFYNYIQYIIGNYRNLGYDLILFQKTMTARCPICNSSTRASIDEGQVAYYECPNCLSQFVIEKIGSIYYIIAHKQENDNG